MTHEGKENTINPIIQECLINEWLPRLYNLKNERKPIQRLMVIIIIFPLVIVTGLLLHMFITDFSLIESSLMTAFFTLSAIAFVYLGKLQACNDVILEIDFAIRLGNLDYLLRAIPKISGFGSFQNLIKEMGGILTHGQ